MKEEKCLFVDLDGTLIKSDLLFECLVPIIKNYFYRKGRDMNDL